MSMRRLVIIEDETDIVKLLEYNFRREGFEVESFGRGREGLESLQRKPPDAVLLDILLPDQDGFEICRHVRADDRLKTIPVIFLTAKGEEVDRILGLEIGADDYVVKPFRDRKSTRLNSSHDQISYAVFCLKKKSTASIPHSQAAHR